MRRRRDLCARNETKQEHRRQETLKFAQMKPTALSQLGLIVIPVYNFYICRREMFYLATCNNTAAHYADTDFGGFVFFKLAFALRTGS